MRCTSSFRKLILTGCCLVTRTVKVISTDPYINGKIIHSSFPSLSIGKKSRDRFRITFLWTEEKNSYQNVTFYKAAIICCYTIVEAIQHRLVILRNALYKLLSFCIVCIYLFARVEVLIQQSYSNNS